MRPARPYEWRRTYAGSVAYLRGKLVSDALLYALCIEHGLQMVSADSDFTWFTEHLDQPGQPLSMPRGACCTGQTGGETT